jgi:integrase/recombinase XerD
MSNLACLSFLGRVDIVKTVSISNLGAVIPNPTYALDVALSGKTKQFVIVDREDHLHVASSWLKFMTDTGRSPNTIKQYGSRVAWYLSWTATTNDWRAVTISHLALWRKVVEGSPFQKGTAVAVRSQRTVDQWIAPLRSFYEWADAEGLLSSDVASRMTQLKYFAPGTRAGGEYGAKRPVLSQALKPSSSYVEELPKWIDDPVARQKLVSLELPTRDRFLVDLLYFTGIRVGEALSLFTRDLHFGGGSPELGCKQVHPHFHVRLDNAVENGARAKGRKRLMFVPNNLVERYIDYILERTALRDADTSPHVFVNLYARDRSRGKAMSYSGAAKLMRRCARAISFDMSGAHTLRHTFATRLVHGIECEPQSLPVVQALMGHASIESTRIYTHLTESAGVSAMQSVAGRPLDLKVGQ